MAVWITGRSLADTFIMLEQVGHRLDREVERLYQKYEAEGLKGMNITHAIEANVDLSNVLKRCAPQWDGGFVICGLTGSGESFSVRDPWGIRPAFYYPDRFHARSKYVRTSMPYSPSAP